MNDLKPKALVPVEIEGAEPVELVVRNIDGEGVLFTKDGQMIGHQLAFMGHYYYIGHGAERVTMYRATFKVTHMQPDAPGARK